MKRLILVRHATALPEQFPLKDFDRSLSAVGEAEAKKLADFLENKATNIHFLFCSSARRTSQTASILSENFRANHLKPIPVHELYNASFQALLKHLQAIQSVASEVMLVGHNPGLSQLATVLSSSHPYQFPPAAGLCLEFAISEWSELKSGSGQECWYFTP